MSPVLINIWVLISTLIWFQYLEYIEDLSWPKIAIFSLVIILFGPSFLMATIGMTILHYIMPEGWDKFDDE